MKKKNDEVLFKIIKNKYKTYKDASKEYRKKIFNEEFHECP